MTDAIVRVAGEELALCPERAVHWRRRRMLLVADAHFGKAAAFRTHGVFVPGGTTDATLARLDSLVVRLAPRRIVFLGDFLHAREGRSAAMLDAVASWRASHPGIDMRIVRGNHDRRAGDPPPAVGIGCMDGPVVEPPFALVHHPAAVSGAYALAGHVHPCAVLSGPARQRERLPCFWFGAELGVLPAFGAFAGCEEIVAGEADAVWVVADDQVVRASTA